MTLSDLIAAFRTEADDATVPYLWSDTEVASYFADAENEACIRAGLLVDESTPSVARLAINSSTEWLTLSPLVLQVAQAWLAGDSALTRVSLEQMERYPSWGDQRSRPCCYAVSGDKLRLYPLPTDLGVLVLRVSRLPLNPLSALNLQAEPEIPDSEHMRLLDWALFRAFSKRDADAFDARRVLDYGGRFEGYFGPRPSAHARRQYREARAHQVSFRPF